MERVLIDKDAIQYLKQALWKVEIIKNTVDKKIIVLRTKINRS
jgi:hypothetical protein